MSGASPLDSSNFPLLPSSSSSSRLPAVSPSSGCNWKDFLCKQNDKEKPSNLYFVENQGNEVILSDEDLGDSLSEWELSLVGYAVGKRPFYGALLAAVKRKWNFKGGLELLTLEDDFFLFKFFCAEDYQLVFDSGPCFLNGRPFLFRKWTWDFRLVKEEFSEMPLWIKLPKFPLACWNDRCFSMVASMVDTPIALDNLTQKKQRLSFARVCVLIHPLSPLPSSVKVSFKGTSFDQSIIYDWKPSTCSGCKTFSRDDQSCPKNPQKSLPKPNRGRSKSIPPLKAPTSSTPILPTPLITPTPRTSPPKTITDLNQLPLSPLPDPPSVDIVSTLPDPIIASPNLTILPSGREPSPPPPSTSSTTYKSTKYPGKAIQFAIRRQNLPTYKCDPSHHFQKA